MSWEMLSDAFSRVSLTVAVSFGCCLSVTRSGICPFRSAGMLLLQSGESNFGVIS